MFKGQIIYPEVCQMLKNLDYDPELLTEAQYGGFNALEYDGVFIAFDLIDLYNILKSFDVDRIQSQKAEVLCNSI